MGYIPGNTQTNVPFWSASPKWLIQQYHRAWEYAFPKLGFAFMVLPG
jgi:hypothetical protein